MKNAECLGGLAPAPPVRIGRFELSGKAFLAPMAGITDAAMRRIALRFGATAAVGEMIAAAGFARGDRETRMRLAGARSERGPDIVQIAACDPESAARAASGAVEAGAEWIDLNMGCPCKRVTGGLAGAALMCDLDLARRIVAAAVEAAKVPVSVKMRLGWDEASRNAPALARAAQEEGAALVTVHGRTRRQFYEGRADWAAIAAVKEAVEIPVVANGDCDSPEAAQEMLRLSGADAVMIGRAALGRPWLVGDIAFYLETGRPRPEPGLAERLELALEHLDALAQTMGPLAGVRHARKHLAAYVDRAGFGARDPKLRRALLVETDLDEARGLLGALFSTPALEAAA
jgi:nifR3 family TIM-barrel protein